MVWLPRQIHQRTNASDKDCKEGIVRPTRMLSRLPGHLHQCHWGTAGREHPRHRTETEARLQGRPDYQLLHLALGATGEFLHSPVELPSSGRAVRCYFLEHLLVVEDEQAPLGRRNAHGNAIEISLYHHLCL